MGAVLEVEGLTVEYATDAGPVRAVDDVSLSVDAGEFLGVVGESGCSKSTMLFAIARLLSPRAEIPGGAARSAGTARVPMTEKQLAPLGWPRLSVVMQSAMNALNPVVSIGAQFRD